ncbi:thiamine pyrophosphate-binding protein [Pseudoponticoccus marisrubri]|uniref:Decarboxylase n=1 Tax=Pseudoponticoccus marisrubri TaxID=1685382 RepID=A0A0W7WKS8_9RHOB|nr:thiamine pyrophosphate-binding protein [Pseudoponticoccus marisrubri]KUF11146.1 decarboxylase [Pseudoponticoccus marisrubri]
MSGPGPKVFDILARSVRQEGVETCFALLGDANMNFATRLAETGCRMIHVRHEHCAVAAAMAHARKAGTVGMATVTCGPGLTQLMTALPAAVRAHLPLVVFAGEAPLKSGWYNQAIDQAPFVTATGAAYHSLHHPERMPTALRDAFLQARVERRPVVLGVPFDLQNRDWTGPEALPEPSAALLPQVSPLPPHPDDLAQAVSLVQGARRVVVMAGLGAVEAGAGPACRALAEACDGLLATTLPARGLFHDDPYSIGIAGGFSTDLARACLAEADLVIAVGGSLAHHNSDAGKLWPGAQVLQIDTHPVAVSQGRVAARAHLRADARLGVEALSAALSPRPADWRSADLARRIATEPPYGADFPAEPGVHDPREVVAALEAALPGDWEMVNSSGHCSFFFAQMPSRPQSHFLTIREFGAIGNGISFAMGVAAARPDSTVVLFDGDGSLLMHVQELETIRRTGMNILIVAMNDGAYGSEIHKLRAEGLDDAGAVFGRTDLASIARGFGIGGETITDLSAIPEMVARFAVTGGAAVWDIPVSDRVYSPVIARAHPEIADRG